jgi:hypothetical protein
MKLQSVLLALIAGALWIQVIQHYQTPPSVFAQSGPSRAPTAQVTTVRLVTTPLDVRVVEEPIRMIGPQDVRIVGQSLMGPLDVRLVGKPPQVLFSYKYAPCGLSTLGPLGADGWEVVALLESAERQFVYDAKSGKGKITLNGDVSLEDPHNCAALLKRPN